MDAQTQTDMDKVIARIQKLFARSTRAGDSRGGATEAEADTAMRMAQELMTKYNLDVAAIEAAARPDANAGAQRTKEEVSSRTRYEWQRQLAKYVAEAHFCYHLVKESLVRDAEGHIVYLRGGEGKAKMTRAHVFVGRKANVIPAQHMFNYLVDTIEDLAPTEDFRVQVGRIGHGSYKGENYKIKIIDGPNGPRFQRYDTHDATSVYDSVSDAGRAITGQPTNGFVFFNLGEASTAESWKKGAADRICERLAQRRRDLIEQHDVRVQQAEADAKAEQTRRAAEAKAASERRLGADAQAEADAVVDGLRAGARRAAAAPSGLEAERPPEGAEDADWTPGTGAEQSAAPTTSAMVLASVYDANEQEANYELAHGLEPGSLARRRAESERRQREWEEGRAAREAAAESAKREEPVRVETEKERLRREAKEAKELAAQRKRWAREDEREARQQEKKLAKVDHRAYREGQKKGDAIGLDAQITSDGGPKTIGN